MPNAATPEVFVIGLSCRFPESRNPRRFWRNLLEGRDMVTADARRWPVGLHGLPARNGILLDDLSRFDAAYFKIHGRQAQALDPQLRLLLEVSTEALIDAEVLTEVPGTTAGVYIGSCNTELIQAWHREPQSLTGYENVGTAQSMFANRLSYTYDLHGPSKNIDTACSSSLVALHDAVTDLQRGVCSVAIVGGSNLLFDPARSLGFQRLGMLSSDGRCKSFDAEANGYVRSEGIGVVVLSTRPEHARLGYARILATGVNNDGFTKAGITFPSGTQQVRLIEEVQRAARVDAAAIQYIEAHGTGTVAGDAEELSALAQTYGRHHTPKTPLRIGSVKSNMGHSEGASGMAGLIKLLLAYEAELLPGNLHYTAPNTSCTALREGRMVVPVSATPWQGGLSALSSFGFGGTNAHVILAGIEGSSAAPRHTAPNLHPPAMRPWDHTQVFPIPSYEAFGVPDSTHTLSPASEKNIYSYDLRGEYRFLLEHKIDGRVLVPGVTYLYSVWRALADKADRALEECSVDLRDIEFHQAVTIDPDNPQNFSLILAVTLSAAGNFEVRHQGSKVSSGRYATATASSNFFTENSVRARHNLERGSLTAYHRYPHGHLALSILLAIPEALKHIHAAGPEGITHDVLCAQLNASNGYLATCLRTLQAMGWIHGDLYTPTSNTPRPLVWDSNVPFYPARLPQYLRQLSNLQNVAARLLRGDVGELESIVEHVENGWSVLNIEDTSNARIVGGDELRDFLNGYVIVAVHGALHLAQVLNDVFDIPVATDNTCPADECGRQIPPGTVNLCTRLWSAMGWLQHPVANNHNNLQFNRRGRYVIEHSTAFLTLSSYYPLFVALPERITKRSPPGLRPECPDHKNEPSPSIAAPPRHLRTATDFSAARIETHVDRHMNVFGSGFQHRAYFDALAEHVQSAVEAHFDTVSDTNDTLYIVDMGCGDGSLLATIYNIIFNSTHGTAPHANSVLLVGVDLNSAALEQTHNTLQKIGAPHAVLPGDMGDPLTLMRALKDLGATNKDHIIHVRSFLDHDRPYKKATQPCAHHTARNIAPFDSHTLHVDPEGHIIPRHHMHADLVQHLRRWREVLGRHGLFLLEVFSQDHSHAQTRDSSPSFHFDTYHALSHQWLTTPALFLRAAAEAGLFPEYSPRTYPQRASFVRIALMQLRKKSYRIRPACLGDMPRLKSLEAACQAANLHSSTERLHEILDAGPGLSLVVEEYTAAQDEPLYAAVLIQRIDSAESLQGIQRARELSLHSTHGDTLQLLALFVKERPNDESLQENLASVLMRQVLLQASFMSDIHHVVGVTRCRRWPDQKQFFHDQTTYVQRLFSESKSTTPPDPGPGFHKGHGANFLGIVDAYWPADTENDGQGVLIAYDTTMPGSRSFDAARTIEAPHTTSSKPRVGTTPENTTTSAHAHFEGLIRAAIGHVMQYSSNQVAALSPTQTWRTLGIDSLELVTLSTELNKALRFPIQQDTLLEFDTVQSLSTQLQTLAHQKEHMAPYIRKSNSNRAPSEVIEVIEGEEVYRQLSRRGYHYGETFRPIQNVAVNNKRAHLSWTGNWITFLDGMLQAGLMADYPETTQLRIPVRIGSLQIYPHDFLHHEGTQCSMPMHDKDSTALPLSHEIQLNPEIALSRCPGIVFFGWDTAVIERRHQPPPHVGRQIFFAYGEHASSKPNEVLYLHILDSFLQHTLAPILDRFLERHKKRNMKRTLHALSEAQALLHAMKPVERVSQEAVEQYIQDPQGILLRMFTDLVGDTTNFENTVKGPIRLITAHSEHTQLYHLDYHAGGPQPSVLHALLSIAAENTTQALNICEIGSGTGGLTKRTLSSLGPHHIGRYLATDITPFFSTQLDRELSAARLNTQTLEFGRWDINTPAPEKLKGPFDLLLASNAVHTCSNIGVTLSHLFNALIPGGFLCFFEATSIHTALLWGLDPSCWTHDLTEERVFGLWTSIEHWKTLLKTAGFDILCIHRGAEESSALFLCQRPKHKVQTSCLHLELDSAALNTTASTEALETQLRVLRETLGAQHEQDIVLVGRGSKAAGTIAMARSLRQEPTVATGLLNRHASTAEVRAVYFAEDAASTALPDHPQLGVNIFQNGTWGTYVDQPLEFSRKTPPEVAEGMRSPHKRIYAQLNWAEIQRTRLEKETVTRSHHAHDDNATGVLQWHCISEPAPAQPNAPITYNFPAKTLDCRVHCVGLNFRDIMLLSGRLRRHEIDLPSYFARNERGFATEFSGSTMGSGSQHTPARVMGIVPNALASYVNARAEHIWDIPTDWSFVDAATVPIVYSTLYYALVMRANIQKGQRVLIHSGAGALGYAAIAFCLGRGCEVFTTCGTEEKRDYLLQHFKGLQRDHIASSRQPGFELMVKTIGNTRGVHVVLNTLSGALLQESVRCVAPFGHFVELGKFDLIQRTSLSMHHLLPNVSVHGIDITQVMTEPALWAPLWKHVQAGIETGEVQPLPATIFEHASDASVARAVVHMTTGDHRGKTVISGLEALSTTTVLEDTPTPSFSCDTEGTYLITGGLGGFGLQLALWLAERGARHLLLTSRRGVTTGIQHRTLNYIRTKLGCTVNVSSLDVGDTAQADELINGLRITHQTLAGVFHLAMVLDDKLFQNQTAQSWKAALEPKLCAARNLDRLTRGVVQTNRQTQIGSSKVGDFSGPTAHHIPFVVFSSIAAQFGNRGQSNYAYANMAMEAIAEQRRADGYHALAVRWGPVADVGFVARGQHTAGLDIERSSPSQLGAAVEHFIPQSIDSCLATLDTLLSLPTSAESAVFTIYQPQMRPAASLASGQNADTTGTQTGLLQRVLRLLALEPHDTLPLNTCLQDLGVDSLLVIEIQSIIHQHTNRPMGSTEVQALTLAQIQQLEAPPAGADAHNARSGVAEILRPPVDAHVGETGLNSTNIFEWNTRPYDKEIRSAVEPLPLFRAVFFFSGMGSVPTDIPIPTTLMDVCIVHWERCQDLKQLQRTILNEIRRLPAGTSIEFWGHSAGNLIHQWLRDHTPQIRWQVTCTIALCVPSARVFAFMEDLPALKKLESRALESRWSTLPFIQEHSSAARPARVSALLAQSLLLQDAYPTPHPQVLQVDIMVRADNDNISVDKQVAERLAKIVLNVEGNHDIRSLHPSVWNELAHYGTAQRRPGQPQNRRAIVFPGQGAQFKGMGRHLFNRHATRVEEAEDTLGYDLEDLCLNDPAGDLARTSYTQPVMFILNALHYMDYIERHAEQSLRVEFFAGHSLGEYNALHAAGVFSFHDGIRLTMQRGSLMQHLQDKNEGAMAAIMGASPPRTEELLQLFNLSNIDIANFNAPTQQTIAGPLPSIESAVRYFNGVANTDAAGTETPALRALQLKVGAACHSRYMRPAADAFRSFLDTMVFAPPNATVLSNATGKPHDPGDAAAIKAGLVEQLYTPVRWTSCVRWLRKQHHVDILEIGPRRVLTNFVGEIIDAEKPETT